ncbi:MAG: phospholipid/cholesterol/gamma-HCH transport system substrate-binding protein [Mycobacterium sp.]|jgi:phospholipid/cholesterol/gamma-HCH transport system substrate-binding protein|nr:phospholipid/cholesterol/gamma-HCH transport system substrate-binding protein [Mycobacterium sp.]
MLKYRGPRLIRTGFIGVVLAILIIGVGLQPERLMSLATQVRYQALFADGGGLAAGNDVRIAGMKVGTVKEVSLQGKNALVTFSLDGTAQLGSQTTAHIRTGTVLGARILTLESAGAGTLRQLDVIPLSRTSSPYSLTEALDDLTTNTAGTNTDAINQSLDTLSVTLDQIAPQLGPMFEGLTRSSQALNERDQTLADLLRSARDVSGILSERSQQVNTLILNANDLLDVLAQRRAAIVDLLQNTSAVAKQLSGLVADNEKELAPTLDKLNSVTAMLEKNRDNIAKALPGLSKFSLSLGETVSGAPYYNAFVANLQPGALLQPFMDYAFGFRRGVDAGQPPDNAGPRAELPWPHNAIPGGTR